MAEHGAATRRCDAARNGGRHDHGHHRPFIARLTATAWRWSARRLGKKVKIVDSVDPCERCPDDAGYRRTLGCGYAGAADAGTRPHPARPGEIIATCPHYVLREDDDAVTVWSMLEDYRRGALGPVWALPACLWHALRALDGEVKSAEAWVQERAMEL